MKASMDDALQRAMKESMAGTFGGSGGCVVVPDCNDVIDLVSP